LKKVKKNWSHEFKCAKAVTITKTQGAKMRGDTTTTGMADLRCIHYVTRLTPIKWHSDCFIRTASCKAERWNNFWNKIHRWFHSHFLLKNFQFFSVYVLDSR